MWSTVADEIWPKTIMTSQGINYIQMLFIFYIYIYMLFVFYIYI